MADAVFKVAYPDLRAKDAMTQVDGRDTYALQVVEATVPRGGIDTVFLHGDQPLKAIDLGGGDYALDVVVKT